MVVILKVLLAYQLVGFPGSPRLEMSKSRISILRRDTG
jgi:hypothetical protein